MLKYTQTALEVGQRLTTRELADYLGITYDSFKQSTTKKRYMDNFSLYYSFKQEKVGRSNVFTILEVKGTYYPPGRVNDRTKNNKVYQKSIIELIEKEPVQNYKTIESNICLDKKIKSIGHSNSYTYDNVRFNTKELFGDKRTREGKVGRLGNKVWVKRKTNEDGSVHFSEMPESHVKQFLKMYTKERIDIEKIMEELEATFDYENDFITREEYNAMVGDYTYVAYSSSIITFSKMFGYTPERIPKYEFDAFKLKELEAIKEDIK